MHWTVTAVLLTAHLLLVNLAMIGPLTAVWFDWRARRESQPEFAELGRRLAWIAVWGLVLGGLLGGLLLAIRYTVDDRYFRALAVVPRDRLWFAGAEWLFSLACLVLYAALWHKWQRGRLAHGLLAIAAATNLMIHFPTLFVAVSVIRARPGLLAEPLARADYRRLLIEPEVLARVLHLWLAAAAVTGVVVVWLALGRRIFTHSHAPAQNRQTGTGSIEQSSLQDRIVKLGGRIAMTAVMLQFPVGLWVAFAMPERARRSLMGADAQATLLFLGAVGLAMLLMNLLSAVILGDRKREMARRSTVVLIVLMLLMVGVRLRSGEQVVRPAEIPAAAIAPVNSPGSSPVPRSSDVPLASRETSGSMESPATHPPRPFPRVLP